MAIEFFTGFEGCADLSDIQSLCKVTTSSGADVHFSSTGGYNNSKCFRTTQRRNYVYVELPITSGKTKAIGFHVKGYYNNDGISLSYKNQRSLIWFKDSNGKYITIWADPNFAVYYDNTLLGSISSKLTTNLHHVEAEVFSDTTNGHVKVKVDGELIINEENLNTGGYDIESVAFASYSLNSTNIYWDNIYGADELQGEIYSYLLKPSSDASVQFTPLSGTDNFAMLQTDDGDTSYVESDTIGHKDLYEYEDLPVELIPISASVVINARKEGTGVRTLQSISKQDLTEYNDSEITTLPTVYPNSPTIKAISRVRSLAPDGTAWTREKINAMQWGFKVAG